MQKGRISTKGLPLLVFLTQMLLAVAASEQCEVKDIQVTTPNEATFLYNFTYKDPSCSNKGELMVKVKSCGDGQFSYIRRNEGAPTLCEVEGSSKVTLGSVESTCFNCTLGLDSRPLIGLELSDSELRIKMTRVHPNVTNWNITIYKATMPWNATPCKGTTIKEIKERFENTGLQPKTSRKEIKLTHPFEKDGCYCFVMWAITNVSLWYQNETFSTETCKPSPSEREIVVAPNDEVPTSDWTWVMLAVLVGIVCLVVIVLIVILSKQQYLDKLTGVGQGIAHLVRRHNHEKISQRVNVLLLHAPDVSGSDHLARLKKDLRENFKVDDLYDNTDLMRLANQCDWIEKNLMPDSGVKLLLVESVGMMDLIDSLLQSCSGDPRMEKATPASCKLLVYALRTIISTNLTGNYSTVFVVRFSDEVKDITELLVKMKRYKFPDHIKELKKDMTRGRSQQEQDQVV